MSRAEKTIELLGRLWDDGDLDVIDELYTENYVSHSPQNPLQGREEMRDWARQVLRAFPDFHINFHEWIEQVDMVAVRWTASGTHRGDFRGVPATNKTVVIPGMSYSKYSGNMLAESWIAMDDLGMMQQLGVIPVGSGSDRV